MNLTNLSNFLNASASRKKKAVMPQRMMGTKPTPRKSAAMAQPKDNMAKSALNVATRPYRAAAKAAGKVLGGVAATPKKALGTGGAAPLMKAVAKAKRPDMADSIERGIQRGMKNFRVR